MDRNDSSGNFPFRIAEKDYRVLLDQLPEGVGITDVKENIVYVNRAFSSMLGYSVEELIGKNIENMIPESEIEKLHTATQKRLHGMASAYNIRMIRKDSSEIIVRVSGVPQRDESGTVIGTMAVVIDVTSEEQAEEELRKLSRAVEQSPASVVITDAEGTIEYVNEKFTELTGYSVEEAIGKNPNVLKSNLTPTETYDELWSTISIGKEWRGTFINRKKDGNLYYEEAWISPISNSDGIITHYVAVKQDITKQIEAESLLRDSIRDLELYSSFLQHDLRNDLQVLMSHAEAARMLSEHDENLGQYLETVEGVAERMVRLLDVFGRPGSEERNIMKILDMVRAQAEKTHSGLEIRVISHTNDELLLESARLVPIIFDNLVRNSLEFANGKVKILIEVKRVGKFVEVLFTDNGPGIHPDVRARLFEKGASTTGGGYGLYLSRKVVNAYGGTIKVFDNTDVGAAFRIMLPLS